MGTIRETIHFTATGVVLLLVAQTALAASTPPTYRISQLPLTSETFAAATAINDSGTIV